MPQSNCSTKPSQAGKRPVAIFLSKNPTVLVVCSVGAMVCMVLTAVPHSLCFTG